ncbi:hypothetical protein [Clostridium baratii]|nr:hypothetical protein [Clostridium baratii]MDU1054420.1 hypothetical protein [Clostridium baratii]
MDFLYLIATSVIAIEKISVVIFFRNILEWLMIDKASAIIPGRFNDRYFE